MSKVYILKIHVDNRSTHNIKYCDRIIDVFANEKDARKAMNEFDLADYWLRNHMELRAGIWEELNRYSPEEYFINSTFVDEYEVNVPTDVRLVAFKTYEIINEAGFISIHIHEHDIK